MIRLLLFLCCILIGIEFLDKYTQVDNFSLDWLPLVQRIAIFITALFLAVTEYLKIKSFNITMVVFLLVALIFNPFQFLEIKPITKIATLILFFIQAIKTKNVSTFNRL